MVFEFPLAISIFIDFGIKFLETYGDVEFVIEVL
jgi:hypothetical protein